MNDNLPPRTSSVPIATDEAHVWSVRLDVDANRYVKLQELLTLNERQRADFFQLDVPRSQFVITRAILRMLLSHYFNVPLSAVALSVDGNGKPRIEADRNLLDLRFNVAHSGALALVAVTQGCEVGVDVEQLRLVGHAAQIAERYFHPTEIQAIVAALPNDRDAAFLRCWTAKEAVLKAIGTGITSSLAEFCVPLQGVETSAVEVNASTREGGPTRCFAQRLDVGKDYLAAVAFAGSPRKVQLFEFNW